MINIGAVLTFGYTVVLLKHVTVKKTSGDIPSKCSGAVATVIYDTMYIVAEFHKVVVSVKR